MHDERSRLRLPRPKEIAVNAGSTKRTKTDFFERERNVCVISDWDSIHFWIDRLELDHGFPPKF
jgi:hypothetical protein